MEEILMLTVSYQTSRKHCQFWWFISSLRRQAKERWGGGRLQVVVVDFWAQELPWYKWGKEEVKARLAHFKSMASEFPFLHVPPKPTVNQGPHRLTKNDYFSPSNARNTALCCAKGEWLAYVDDVSVLRPEWLKAVELAMNGNYICCGAFRKVKNLVVEKGLVKSFDPHMQDVLDKDGKPTGEKKDVGMDSRWMQVPSLDAVDCPPSWLFGCSVVVPCSALEKINGWPEAVCDSTGVGAEDGYVGIALKNTGHNLKYDKRMLTYESEELHGQQPQMLRMNKGDKNKPKEMKDWKAVYMLKDATRFDNNFHPFPDVAALRRNIVNGGSFPVPTEPKMDWYDSQPLSEL
jgi:hypothetical protein